MTTHRQDAPRHMGSVEQVLWIFGALAVVVLVVIAALDSQMLSEKIAGSIASSMYASGSIR